MATQSIHDAAGKGDLDAVKALVAEDPTLVNQDDEHEWRAIFHAGLQRRYDVVKFLIDHGADLSAHDGYVMHFAGEVPNNKEVVSLLVAYGGLDSHTEPANELARQFIYAVFMANEKRVHAMLREHPSLVHERYARCDTALHHATRNGDLEVVKQLVTHGADVDVMSDNKHFPLYCAAGHGHVETVRFLIEQGVDVNAQLDDGKNTVEWLAQYAEHDSRFQVCLEVLKG